MRCYMGVDIGTSGCKAAVFDEKGSRLAYSYREYNVISNRDRWAELDSDLVISLCFEVIAEAAKQSPGSVAGMAISSQGEAFTPVDKQGNALCNCLVSSDSRAIEYVNRWANEFGIEKLYNITGHTPHPMFSLFKLLWLLDNRPDITAKTDKYLCFEDLLQLRLGLKPSISYSLAGRTMLFDVKKESWSKEILQSVGVDERKFAQPLPSGKKAGVIDEKIAARLNLSKGAFVAAGGHDQPCSALGADAASPAAAVYSTGTVECLTPAFSRPIFSKQLMNSNLCTYHHTAENMYATVAFSLTGGNLLKWFRDQFGQIETEQAAKEGIDAYKLLFEQMPDKPTDILVLPYFTPTGTPYFDTEVKGMIYGLTLSATRGQVLRSLLEGVAMEMRLNLEILEDCGYVVNELRAIGGGAKSEKWVQLKADILNKPITVLNVTEAGCMGAAILAAAAEKQLSATNLAKSWIKPKFTVQPQTANVQLYNQNFERYKQLYPMLKKISL